MVSLARTIVAGVLVNVALVSAAAAQMRQAMCEVRKEGEVKKGQSGPCTISETQGYVEIVTRKGDRYALRPAKEANKFKDHDGAKVVRRQVEGGGVEFKWEGKRVIVTPLAGAAPASMAPTPLPASN
jgi:hypothetical protein